LSGRDGTRDSTEHLFERHAGGLRITYFEAVAAVCSQLTPHAMQMINVG